MYLITNYEIEENVSENNIRSEFKAGQVWSVYRITYHGADLSKFPTRKSFGIISNGIIAQWE